MTAAGRPNWYSRDDDEGTRRPPVFPGLVDRTGTNTAAPHGLPVPVARGDGRRPRGPMARHRLHHLLCDRSDQPPDPTPTGLVRLARWPGLALSADPGRARHHRDRGHPAAAGEVVDGLSTVLALATHHVRGQRARTAVGVPAGRGGLLRIADR